PAPEAAAISPELDLPQSPLDARFTFDTFVVGKPNELAHAAARRVADRDSVSFNPLFLYGGVGLGKTHLMHAIAWGVRQSDPSARILYLSAEQFMYRFISALRFKEMHGFKELFRSVDMLMVDDVQFIAGKDSTQDEFFHTFNALIDQHKQIIISADRAPGEIDGLEERIKSRLQWGLVVDLHPTDYELRLGILQSKAEAQLLEHPGVTIGSGVMEFLAHRISSNVRVLEGALNRLFAFASLVGRDINLDMTQECLADILRASERKVTIEEILRKVADHYNLRMSDLLSARRARNVARPRQVAMYLAKTLTSRSLPDIGRRFGGRDHTTVIHAVRKIEELKATDSQIAEDVELLRRMLEA
ncbi:chromosomal replication initiator protein DnaA, partial [Amaricoccus sp. HAR-UPW-R2A-40]